MVRLSVLALTATAGLVGAQKLDLSVNQTSGAFSINLDGSAFLAGSEYVVQNLTASSGDLVQTAAATTSTGTDAFGSFSATTLSWGSKSSDAATLMTTTFKTYSKDDGLIVFEQHFPADIKNQQVESAATLKDNEDTCRVITAKSFKLTKSVEGYSAYTPKAGGKPGEYDEHAGVYCDDNHDYVFTGDIDETACAQECEKIGCTCFDVSKPHPPKSDVLAQSVFPAFSRTSPSGKDLDVFSYHGVFPSLSLQKLSSYEPSHQGGAPAVIYDADGAELPMAVFSPVNYPKAQHFTSTGEYFGAGVKSTVTLTPAGWTQKFMLSAGHGINAGMMAWGDRMLTFTGKTRPDFYLDQTHSTIGFWTDNGGYYHYSTGTNKSALYETVLPEVKAYHDSIGVPFGHWQFDSWFYPKDGGVGPGGGGGAVVNWTAMPSVFPSGMAAIQAQLGKGMVGGMPTIMHNRQWSDKSDYIKNLAFEWYESKYAIPKDPIAFFEWFFQQQEGWGLSMYEQDWMCTEYDGVDALQQNISMGDLWLKGMATGAASSNRTVQYCMPYPHDVLHASAEQAVTNARATGDYFHAANQWSVGNPAMFYWAIGVLPFKDGFYSSNNKQIGGQTVGPETSPDREIIMATLSCAMVGPMDGINLLNKTRTMASCRGDGVVLKPDRPVMTSDQCFADRNPEDCFISHTYSAVQGLDATVHYLFSSKATNVTDKHFFLDASKDKYMVYNFYTGTVAPLAASNVLEAGYEGHVYAVAAPITGDLAFVGEPDKYTTASSKRFSEGVTAANNQITAKVTGSAGETVNVCAVQVSKASLVCESAKFTQAGTQSVVLKAA